MLGIQLVAISVGMQELHLLRPPALGEEQHGCLHAGVGLEHATGQAQHGMHRIIFHQLPAQFLMRVGGTEQHALWHNNTSATAGFKYVEHVADE